VVSLWKAVLSLMLFVMLVVAFLSLASAFHPELVSGYRTIFWEEMKWNLLNSLIDFLVVALFVPYLISIIDDRKWAPARKLVAYNGSVAAAWAMHAGYHSFKNFGDTDRDGSIEMRSIFLSKFVDHLNQFESSVHLCNAGLGRDLMPTATNAVWNMKKLVPLYVYLLETLRPQVPGEGFVYQVPEQELMAIFSQGQQMLAISGRELDSWFVNHPDKTIEAMKSFVREAKDIYFDGQVPQIVPHKSLCLYDANMLRRLAGASNIQQVRIFTEA
jgi:hypothetical protein